MSAHISIFAGIKRIQRIPAPFILIYLRVFTQNGENDGCKNNKIAFE